MAATKQDEEGLYLFGVFLFIMAAFDVSGVFMEAEGSEACMAISKGKVDIIPILLLSHLGIALSLSSVWSISVQSCGCEPVQFPIPISVLQLGMISVRLSRAF